MEGIHVRTAGGRLVSSGFRVTIYDVAAKAGVSTATVSRILSGYRTYRPETCERVHSIVRELGYTPNLQARNLALGWGERLKSR